VPCVGPTSAAVLPQPIQLAASFVLQAPFLEPSEVKIDPTKYPWLWDKRLANQLAVYSQTFAQIVRGLQPHYIKDCHVQRPDTQGVVWLGDDPDAIGTGYDLHRRGQTWTFELTDPPQSPDAADSPNVLKIDATTWGLYLNSHKVAEGPITH
jgi:hypothetical protein